MKRIGLANVRRESFTVPVSWERGSAAGWVVSVSQTEALSDLMLSDFPAKI